MFLRTFLNILGAAVLSTAAQAASPCETPGAQNCDRPAATTSAATYEPAAKLASALALKQVSLGMEHPETLAAANALAAMYKGLHKYKDAEFLYLRSLDASERTLGKNHVLTLGTARGLAALYEAEGRKDEAAQLYKRASDTGPAQLSY